MPTQSEQPFKIIAIDDAKENLLLLEMLMEEFFPNASIKTALNGESGLELVINDPPDIILLDAIMPGIDGFEVCRQLKNNPDTLHIPVLMISGIKVDAGARVSGLEGGADSYICKPYEAEELVAQMNALLRLKKSEDELKEHKNRLEQELDKQTDVLQDTTEKFHTLFQSSPDAIFVQDEAGVILHANPAAYALHKVDEPGLIGRNFREFLPSGLRSRLEQDYKDLFTGEASTIESILLDSDGHSVPVEIRGALLERGDHTDLLLTARDISDRQQARERESDLQARLIRSQRMESLGVLAGGVAHDLNNILGPMVAYPDIILDKLPKNHEATPEIEQMGKSATRAVAIIQDLLSLARRGNYRSEPVLMNDIIASYSTSPEFLEQQSLHPKANLATRLQPDLPPIIGSSPHLMQVVMNLVNNAFEAMPHGGRVTISTHCKYTAGHVSVYDTIPEGDYVILRVTDHGPGMTPHDLEHIFEPFYTKKEMGRSGSGLGLPVVYGVTKDLKGHIDVKTEPGKGTEFSIYFPVAAKLSQRKNLETSATDLKGSETILIVDDVEEQRLVGQSLLGSLGYKVVAVSSGLEAVEFLKERKVDLLVLDMILEDQFDGMDTYRAITEFRPDQRCILVSGFSETGRVRKAQALGAGSYIRKPYTRSSLGQAVREELDRPSRMVA